MNIKDVKFLHILYTLSLLSNTIIIMRLVVITVFINYLVNLRLFFSIYNVNNYLFLYYYIIARYELDCIKAK